MSEYYTLYTEQYGGEEKMEAKNRKKEKPYQSKKWLEENYTKKGLSMETMATEASCSRMTISRALREHGVKSRSLKVAMIHKVAMKEKKICMSTKDEKTKGLYEWSYKYLLNKIRKIESEEASLDDLIEEACRARND